MCHFVASPVVRLGSWVLSRRTSRSRSSCHLKGNGANCSQLAQWNAHGPTSHVHWQPSGGLPALSLLPLSTLRCLACSATKVEGVPLDTCIGPGLRLIRQEYKVGDTILNMIAPEDVDAVMDWYIEQGGSGSKRHAK